MEFLKYIEEDEFIKKKKYSDKLKWNYYIVSVVTIGVRKSFKDHNIYNALNIRDAWNQWKEDHKYGWGNYFIYKFEKFNENDKPKCHYHCLENVSDYVDQRIKDKFYDGE